MKLETIYLDMDGVLADFHSSALRVHGLEPIPRHQWPAGKPLLKILNNPYDSEAHKAAFWNPINSDPLFWEEIEPYYWVDELIEVLESKIGRGNLYLATAASREPSSYSGKRQWLLSNGLGRFEPIMIQNKSLLSHPGALLIDDWEKHEGFTKRGGHFCLFPQPWNRNHAEATDPVRYVARYLENFERNL